jgi:hypothetical protein
MKLKKSAKPKASTRIVTKVKRASMPDIQLPEMSGIGEGFAGGLGGFEIMPISRLQTAIWTAPLTAERLLRNDRTI